MERTLTDWLPDDALWGLLDRSTLQKQCAARNLPVSGPQLEMVKRLRDYEKVHRVEERAYSWRMIWGRGFGNILYNVLNCPEPLRWQLAFLSSENGQDALCALCFKAVSSTEGDRTRCITCGRVMHTSCDETEWGIDKYCEPGQVQYPLVVSGTKAAPQILPGPGRNTSQQQTERRTSDDVIIESSGSSRGEHSGGPPANNPPPPPNGDSALGTTTAPASVTISDSAQAPASVAASVGDTTSTTTNTHSSDDNSAKLARDRGRLAKKSAEMRKRAKREYKRLSKKYKKELNKELKKLRKKSKRELKTLMKESKKLEKRAKGLGGGREAGDDV
ncbi:hypothetical protein QBC32DRAFT_373637 [Pseudoneurospora amorphoporcata]|uniref:SAP domain-containing protein n=1 Tax=Pseudoneurospora amorphoporcata TaxID=241081 RepID=A0AAN6NM29_9PEZI|nr:hypothetical protein QBC32DRAFT_373637 [Pseudoneurospora amorphoporcata]